MVLQVFIALCSLVNYDWLLDPILGHWNLQLLSHRCSRLERFFKVEILFCFQKPTRRLMVPGPCAATLNFTNVVVG
jgi:hypothetical protein